MRRTIKIAFSVLLALILVEAAVRASGIVSFPLYNVDQGIGYIPKPNQQGVFLHVNAWVFNNRSMGTGKPWNPTAHPNILLIGNSVVMGGDHFTQHDKLGPVLQRDIGSGFAVWAIAANGWSTVNETVYLDRNPDVVHAAHYFIWEYMRGGLSAPNLWPGEYTIFPKHEPVWATWYVFRRFVLPRIITALYNSGLPPMGDSVNAGYLAQFQATIATLTAATTSKAHGLIFLYPVEAEYLRALKGEEWLPERPVLMRIAAEDGLQVVDIAKSKLWNATLYRDDHIHPTVEGNIVLAKILATAAQQDIAR